MRENMLGSKLRRKMSLGIPGAPNWGKDMAFDGKLADGFAWKGLAVFGADLSADENDMTEDDVDPLCPNLNISEGPEVVEELVLELEPNLKMSVAGA